MSEVAPPLVAPLRIMAEEGAAYMTIYVHALLMPDGSRWDVRNGWTARHE